MTLAEQSRVRFFRGRDGSYTPHATTWEHRRMAMMIRHDSMRGLPDDAREEDAPAWKRSQAARDCRLARDKERSHG